MHVYAAQGGGVLNFQNMFSSFIRMLSSFQAVHQLSNTSSKIQHGYSQMKLATIWCAESCLSNIPGGLLKLHVVAYHYSGCKNIPQL